RRGGGDGAPRSAAPERRQGALGPSVRVVDLPALPGLRVRPAPHRGEGLLRVADDPWPARAGPRVPRVPALGVAGAGLPGVVLGDGPGGGVRGTGAGGCAREGALMARARKKSPDTENEKLRRRIKNRALAASYRHLRETYRQEWGQL